MSEFFDAAQTLTALQDFYTSAERTVFSMIAELSMLGKDGLKRTLETYPFHEPRTPSPSPAFVGPPARITGNLSNSVEIVGPRPLPALGIGFGGYEALVGTTMIYTRTQEFGSRDGKVPPRPFIQHALDDIRAPMYAIYFATVRRIARGR